MLSILCTEELNLPFNCEEDAYRYGEYLKDHKATTWYTVVPSDDLEPETVEDIINKFGPVR